MSTADSKAVFLSYASQDAEPAKRLADTLRAAGVEVWFDQSELTGGDAWDAKIRKQIVECALFVPVISAATQARREGYFRIEWRLAAQRTHAMSDDTTFLLPVVIDETRDADARVPAEFRAVQWTRLVPGETSGAFCECVRKLVSTEFEIEPGRPRPVQRDGGVASPGKSRPAQRRWLVPAIFGIASVIALAILRPWHPPAP